jgi:hypothetical protein
MRQALRQWPRWSGALALAALLTGCGGQATVSISTTPTAVPQSIATTAQAAQPAAAVTAATVGPQPTSAAERSATAAPVTTSSPTPASVTVTATVARTATPAPQHSTSATTAAYTADFARWPVATPSGPDPARVTYDTGSKRYTIALTSTDHAYVHWQYAPEGRAFGDFSLDIDGQVLSGPPNGSWGVLFRAQPQQAGDKTNARYDLIITPAKKEVSLNWTSADGQGKVLALATVAAIHTGDAVNHIHVTAQGDHITVAVNDQTVGSATGPSINPGAIGLIVLEPPQSTSSPGMTGAFSRLVVTPIPPK